MTNPREQLNTIYKELDALGMGGQNGVSSKLVPGTGPIPSKIMIIGEAPGAAEDKLGRPFVGPSGNLLDGYLELLHVQREQVFITNLFKYRPPGNRNPNITEINKSVPILSKEILLVDPELIILMGSVATSVFFPGVAASHIRGKKMMKGNRNVIATFHPAATMYRDNASRRQVDRDIKNHFRLAKEILDSD